MRQREAADDARSQRLLGDRPDAVDAELARADRAQRIPGDAISAVNFLSTTELYLRVAQCATS